MSSTQQGAPKTQRVRKAVVFTDLEGSTGWLYQMGPSIVFRALEVHFEILASEFAKHGGEIVKRIGDGVMAVFPTLESAIRASVGAQIALLKARSDGALPLKLPPMRVGMSAGEAYVYEIEKIGLDYFGRVCAEASRIIDLAEGHHILVAANALAQEEFGRDALIADGLAFTVPVRVFRKGLDEVPVSEVLYKPGDNIPESPCRPPDVDMGGRIRDQLISRSRPDIAPFSYFENSEKAHQDIDDFLLASSEFRFLHIRGLVAGSSSPFNRFSRLLSEGKFSRDVEEVILGMLDPECDWLVRYYQTERGLAEEITKTRISECKTALELARNKLDRFYKEGRIKRWKLFLYQQDPIWRLVVTTSGVIATPYGGPQRTVDNIVLFAESHEDPIYQSFLRLFSTLESNSAKVESRP